MTTVGIVGAGQLGMMLGEAGKALDVDSLFLDPGHNPPAGRIGKVIKKNFDDEAALTELAEASDVVTYEFENVPAASADLLFGLKPVVPPPVALDKSQDRCAEKSFFTSLAIPTPNFVAIDSAEELAKEAEEMGYPCVLKTRRMGYDGKGQMILKKKKDCAPAFTALGKVPLILEEFIAFDAECSIIAVRGKGGECVFYPLVKNTHREGILRLSIAPSDIITPALQTEAEEYALSVLCELDYMGVLTIEFFLRKGELIANEMAPRVHNSGHWTIEGAETSQFENHIRAVTGMPLGSAKPKGYSAMINLIGEIPDLKSIEKLPGVFIHLYGKEPRAGRKLGHITIVADSIDALQKILKTINL